MDTKPFQDARGTSHFHILSLSLSLSLACIGIVLQVPLSLSDRNTHTIFPTVDKNQQDNTRAEFSTLEEGGSVHAAHLHSLQKQPSLKLKTLPKPHLIDLSLAFNLPPKPAQIVHSLSLSSLFISLSLSLSDTLHAFLPFHTCTTIFFSFIPQNTRGSFFPSLSHTFWKDAERKGELKGWYERRIRES
jgi:hypothetical protein